MAVGTFITPLVNDWTKPDDWIDISNVGNNEINLLVTDSSVMGFYVYTSSGTYSIDWGDGTVETSRVSGTFYQHTFATGAGTSTSYGYNTVKIRIYNAIGNITQYQGYRPQTPSTLANWSSYSPLLWAVFGTNNLISLQSAFGDASSLYPTILQSVTLPSIISGITGNGFGGTFANAYSLRSVVGLNSTWGNVTSLQNMFIGCLSIERINLPNTLPSTITSMQDMFNGCSALRVINFPSSLPTSLTGTGFAGTFSGCASLRSINITSWPNALTSYALTFNGCNNLTTVTLPTSFPTSLTTTINMFTGCRSLQTITLPTAWPSGMTTTSQMFINCYGLTKVVLPATGSNNLVSCNTMFQSCYNLRDIQNTSIIGSTTTATTLSAFLTLGGGAYITGSLSFGANLSAISVNGSAATQMSSITGVRLTNTGSAFGGLTPQVNVSYTMMDTGSLVNLFNDLTTVSSKAINITGASGAASLTAGQRSIATNKGWTITG